MKTYLYRASYLKSTITCLCFIAEVNFWRPIKNFVSCDLFIRECSSTLYVGLARTIPPNTKFKPLLLPTQAGMPYTNTHKHRTSYFTSKLTFLGPAKRWKSICAARQKPEILVLIIFNFKIFFSNIRSDDIPPRSTCKCLSIGSYSPEVGTFGTLITSTKVFSL